VLSLGDHPLPSARSVDAGQKALALAESVQPGERLLCLLSGGASALMAVPAAGISLDDKIHTTDRLVRAGADITALNTVRKHLSGIKGGGLARRSSAGCHTLAISDVVGDDLAVIGSGPGVADASTFADALDVLRHFGGLEAYPRPVLERLSAGVRSELPETLKPLDIPPGFVEAAVIGDRHTAMDGACRAARTLGYTVIRIEAPIVGDAREAAVRYVRDVVALAADLARPFCVISSGETTVQVTGTGAGGRNQEFALAAATELIGLARGVQLASVGTDGIDGPTEAAGAIVDETTVARALELGLVPEAFANDNDSHTFFRTLGDLYTTGRTGTNVGDLQVFLGMRALD
jgi:hydroxypyruvate reductase